MIGERLHNSHINQELTLIYFKWQKSINLYHTLNVSKYIFHKMKSCDFKQNLRL